MKLSIGKKIAMLVFGTVVLSASLVGYGVYTQSNSLLVKHELNALGQDVQLRGARMVSTIQALRQDVLFLSKTPPVQGLIRAQTAGGIDPVDGSSEKLWRDRLSVIFTELLRAKPHYFQARYIGADAGGLELVDVRHLGDAIIRTPRHTLQARGHRSYFRETVQLSEEAIFLSSINLNREHGAVVIPHIPVLRAATPVYDSSGRVFGVIVVNMDFGLILDSLTSHPKGGQVIYVTNQFGDFLAHPDQGQTFGFDRGEPHIIQNTYPTLAGFFAYGNHQQEFSDLVRQDTGDEVVRVLKVSYDPQQPERFLGLGIAGPAQAVLTGSQALLKGSVVQTLLAIGLATVLGFVVSRRLVRPIRTMKDAMERMAQGDYDVSLPEDTTDEVGLLGRSMKVMADKVRKRTAELTREVAVRKEAENGLLERDARIQGILSTAADGIITIDEGGIIDSFNAAAEKIFGHSSQEIVGKNISLLMPSPYHAEHDQYLERYLKTGVAKIIGMRREVAGLRKDGTIFPLDMHVSEVVVGEHRFFTGIIRDLTERKHAEERTLAQAHELEVKNVELAAARDQALEAARVKTDFLATMSHEIRTPLNGVIGMAGLLMDTELNSEQQDCAETIRSCGDNLLTLINDILDFSKIEAGKLELENIDFDLRVAVEEVLDLLAAKASEKTLELVGLVYANIPESLQGDPGRLRQILLNLVGNAIKFTQQGEVAVQVTLVRETDNEVRVRFDITDTGIGISQESRKKLFQSFSQVDSSTSRKFGGSGLGLAICQQLVELMGGAIGVESAEGTGSCFWFEAPFARPRDSTKRIIPKKSLEGLRICIVDDNGTNRTLLQHYATTWGMKVVSVPDGPQALTVLQVAAEWGEPCDLAIIDSQMPEMDGLELAKRIKRDPLLQSTNLVLLSSIGKRGDAQMAKDLGISGYLPKPVHQAQLYRCLTMVMGLEKMPSTAKNQGDHPLLITRHVVSEAQSIERSRILVAEDNMVNQKITVRMVEKCGCRADVVANGQEALDAVRRIPYDLILMDCMMPIMDGFEATTAIRQLEVPGKDIPIIALTANALQGDREQCLACGMNDYLSKPIKFEGLYKVLNEWLVIESPNSLPSSPSGMGAG